MKLTRTLRTQRGRAVLYTLVPLAAFGAYKLVGQLDAAIHPLDPHAVVTAAPAAAPSALPSMLPSTSRVAAVQPTGLSAEAEDAAKRAAPIAEQPPTF